MASLSLADVTEVHEVLRNIHTHECGGPCGYQHKRNLWLAEDYFKCLRVCAQSVDQLQKYVSPLI